MTLRVTAKRPLPGLPTPMLWVKVGGKYIDYRPIGDQPQTQWLNMDQPITLVMSHFQKQDFRFGRHLKASMKEETIQYVARLFADNRPARELISGDWMLLLGGSQISSHSGSSFPLLLAGGKKLGFKHGQHIKWKSNERSASDLYLTILQQLRCSVDSFKESKGPISELLA